MTLRPLGSTDLRVSPLVLGTGLFGSATSEDESFAILDAYTESGGNFLDTANVYAEWVEDGKGKSETTLGKWLKARNARDSVVLATKGAHADIETEASRMTEEFLDGDIALSLERLQVDSVDLYWLHRDDPAVPVCDILGWLAKLLRQGLVRHIACSNWTWRRIEEVREYAERNGLTGFSASQIGWSLAEADPDGPGPAGMLFMNRETRAWHERTGFPLLAYSSQASGFFSGKYRRGMDPEDRKPGIRPWVLQRYGTPANYDRMDRAREIGARHGASANQVALAWLLHQPFPVFPMIGPGTKGQLAESLGALSLKLDEQEIGLLRDGSVHP